MGSISSDHMKKAQNDFEESEYCRILTAAVINTHFRKMLLDNPVEAVKAGFGGESFNLPKEDKKRISSIQANSLADFAYQLTSTFRGDLGTLPCIAGD